MKRGWVQIFVCIGGIMFFLYCDKRGYTAPPPPCSEKTSTANGQKLLTPAILLKTAAVIQDKYFCNVYTVQANSCDQVKLYKFLTDYILDNTGSREAGKAVVLKDKGYRDCMNEIKAGAPDFWRVKQILTRYKMPDVYYWKKQLLFNPFVFFPDSRGIPGEVTDIYILWDWFYTALFIRDQQFLNEVAPEFWKKLSKNPEDMRIFKNLYRLSLDQSPSATVDAPILANFYLLTGNAEPRLHLAKPDGEKLAIIKKRYDTDYLKQNHITVNAFTLENRIYMWLAARQAELENDFHKTYIYLKTTFDNQVLADVKNFPPNQQVYLYSTMRIALEIRSPLMYRYVIGALEPLTKFNKIGNKEFLVTQLYQLID